MNDRTDRLDRRTFLRGATLAGAAGLVGLRPEQSLAEPPPETTTLKLAHLRSACEAPQSVAEELLKSEGFAEVRYVKEAGVGKALASGQLDISMDFAAPIVIHIDAGDPVVALAGVHIGCFELFGTDRVRTIRDLKGKTVSVPGLGRAQHILLATMAAYVGLDPRKDINFLVRPNTEGMRLFAEGKIDAYLAVPPEAQELRAKRIGRVVVNSALDRPWSQYFCCLLFGNREFVHKHPVATKRALRAILKANSICALEPDRVSRLLVEKGDATRYEYALQTLKDIPYGRWRDYDTEDTIRFYSLHLHEAGMIKSTPQKIIAQGTDWRFLTELKKELKG